MASMMWMIEVIATTWLGFGAVSLLFLVVLGMTDWVYKRKRFWFSFARLLFLIPFALTGGLLVRLVVFNFYGIAVAQHRQEMAQLEQVAQTTAQTKAESLWSCRVVDVPSTMTAAIVPKEESD